MKRLTMSLDDELAEAFDATVRDRGYTSRSEAMRDLLRGDLGAARIQQRPASACVATLSYLYDHHQRQLAMRLMDMQHDHHELIVATTHAHLSHERCVETEILRGRYDRIQAFADAVGSQAGVTHANLHVMPAR